MIGLASAKPMLLKARRSASEFLGISKYSRPSLYGLDTKLEKYLDFDNGFFIEAGANDGFNQSNTYYFEKMRGWTGILVEAIPELYEKCRRTRRKSQVFQCALVSDNFSEDSITIDYANLMSAVRGAFKDPITAAAHLQQGRQFEGITEKHEIKVPARTLTSVLLEAKLKPKIDLLSLDVEGYELDVLQGLDFAKFRPTYLCIEVWDEPAVDSLLLENRYEKVDILNDLGKHKDVLYRAL
jgi:FkbM family methyltransferase